VTLLLLQMAVVMLVALMGGALARRMGQARVIGEIVGGIVLGPSVFGRVAPGAWGALFPQSSFAAFEILSTLGLVLFLFLIGLELDYEHLRKQRATAALASGMSMLLPAAMGLLLTPWVKARFTPVGISPGAFGLFFVISLSITAFPVLAKILEERGMQTSALGATALMCAAVDDVCAWSLLAVALTLLPSAGGGMPLWLRFLLLFGYVGVMVGVVRPLGAWAARRWTGISYTLLAVMLAVVLGSAAATEAIGVHPLFGAFLAGLCFPRVPAWQAEVRARLNTVVQMMLLPLFFALTGMRTRLDLLSGATIWEWTGVILVAAVVGKVGGAVIAARWTGQSWRDAWGLGALLNTRGLVELVVLNIAYKAGVFSPVLFTMLVVMALVTTAMTTPLLDWLGIAGKGRELRLVKAA
jgi:Kef-type K+ transport system membrane component KefB